MEAQVIKKAWEILKEGSICDSCLGRQFAQLATGLTNAERGRAIKIVLAMIADEQLKQKGEKELLELLAPSSEHAQKKIGVKIEQKCWVCGDLFKKLDSLAEKAKKLLVEYEYNTFHVGTIVRGELAEKEEILWDKCKIAQAEPLKAEVNREIGKILQRITQKKVELTRPDIVVLIDLEREEAKLQVNSIFIYGRYRKLVRGIPQTHWPCRSCRGLGCERCKFTGKMYMESVEELITPKVLEASGGSEAIFHGAGREDIDARVLGRGRPFIIEIKEPKRRSLDLKALEQEINSYASGKVEVNGLRFVEKNAVELIKNREADKLYRVKVIFDQAISEEKLKIALASLMKSTIEQRTPQRVVHRRADKIRRRKVLEAELREFKSNEALLEIRCEGGLYVKELISGDGGRTKPSLSELLGVEASAVELDVIDVIGGIEWQDHAVREGKQGID
ncbi:MAG: tRNA pseudouridine(54/55) synthase Pus10 [Methanocellales archaeon]